MNNDIIQWVAQWCKERNPDLDIDNRVNFYESGYLDSFGIIELIEACESHFDIRFSQNDLKNPSFRSIESFSGVIASKIAQ